MNERQGWFTMGTAFGATLGSAVALFANKWVWIAFLLVAAIVNLIAIVVIKDARRMKRR